jgi:hypothetical protein
MGVDCLMPFLKPVVFLDIMEVISSDNNGSSHLS